ncbi:helix-turn-helix transcriptional regulator [Pseudanabaenaceae cyanobacterium LEGE 13415]|nr:helix-turn-helix transcriptional regulator [Pseudanabaenaceae cyanobacterium LEGE 13415]
MPGHSPSSLRDRFGARVRCLRTARGLSQEAFAELACLHRTYLGAIERGERNVSLDNIGKIATALDVTLSELFTQVSAIDE